MRYVESLTATCENVFLSGEIAYAVYEALFCGKEISAAGPERWLADRIAAILTQKNADGS